MMDGWMYVHVIQGWGRLQRHDYHYTMITETDYDYKTMITIMITIT